MSGYTCPRCGRTSHHPRDAAERYCGACHAFEEASPDEAYDLLRRELEAERAAHADTRHALADIRRALADTRRALADTRAVLEDLRLMKPDGAELQALRAENARLNVENARLNGELGRLHPPTLRAQCVCRVGGAPFRRESPQGDAGQ